MASSSTSSSYSFLGRWLLASVRISRFGSPTSPARSHIALLDDKKLHVVAVGERVCICLYTYTCIYSCWFFLGHDLHRVIKLVPEVARCATCVKAIVPHVSCKLTAWCIGVVSCVRVQGRIVTTRGDGASTVLVSSFARNGR